MSVCHASDLIMFELRTNLRTILKQLFEPSIILVLRVLVNIIRLLSRTNYFPNLSDLDVTNSTHWTEYTKQHAMPHCEYFSATLTAGYTYYTPRPAKFPVIWRHGHTFSEL